MSILGSNMLAGAAGRAKHEIERSLRFNDDDDAYLQRQPGSAGNRRTFTFSAWLKRASGLGSDQQFFVAAPSGHASDSAVSYLGFNPDDQLVFFNYWSSALRGQLVTNARLRDVSAWYHIVLKVDTTDSTASNRFKLFINGTEQTYSSQTNPDQNLDLYINDSVEHKLGEEAVRDRYNFDGYMAEINLVDGTALNASYFGETDLETGAWIPRQYNGSHGTNGFYLKFADNSGVTATTLGKDSSGNGNNWTPNNFSVTAGADNDSVLDTPTNNWCTLNSLLGDSLNITSNGNLRVGGTQNNYAVGTIAFPSSGKYYAEATLTTYSSGQVQFGICPTGAQSNLGNDATAILQDGSTTVNNASSTSLASYTQGDVIGIAVDVDNSTVQFYKNNTAQTALTNVLRITEASFFTYLSISSTVINYNFGQQGFKYTPPTGFKALNAKNLPAPTIKDGAKYFNTVLYTGNFSTQSITGVGFKPDWVWIKGRGSATYNNHILTDVVRGAGNIVQTNATAAETAAAATLTSFDSDGFSLGAFEDVNTNSNTYVAWNWKAGGASSNNQDGSITSDVSANPEAGFSIVSWGARSTAGTVGHGLGVAPQVIIMKDRDTSSYPWLIYHQDIGIQKYLAFSTAAPVSTSTAFSTAPTSTVFDPGTGVISGNSYFNMIAYCFAEVEGYSKFGSYTANGSSSGPFVYTGFKPAFVILKGATSNINWQIKDNKRDLYNPVRSRLWADLADAEAQGTDMDFLSNGFKIRESGNATNTSGVVYIYMAFAETPFKYANAR